MRRYPFRDFDTFSITAALIMALVLIVTSSANKALAQSSVLFEDTFSDGNPFDWQVFASGWSEAGGLRLARNTGANLEVASVWPGGYDWTDYAVEGDVRILDARRVSQASLVFRFSSPFPDVDYCRCGFYHGRPGFPDLPVAKYLRLDCNGVDNVVPFDFEIGRFYRLRATAIGTTTTCELLGHPDVARLVTTSDVISCAGTAGLRSTHIRSDFDNFLVTRIDAAPDPACLEAPIANAGPDQVLVADASCTAIAVLDGSASIAPAGDQLLFEWTSAFGTATSAVVDYQLPLGAHPFVLTVTDSDGDTDSDEATVTVLDVEPPSLTAIEAEPSVLWPPNHRMVTVELRASGTDNCAPALECQIVAVSSNEPTRGRGSGITDPDWQVTGPLTVKLRAERAGSGTGRAYSIEVDCADRAGNVSSVSTVVRVAHDKK